MTRDQIEKDAFEASHNLDFQFIPWSNERVVDFAIAQVNAALEEACKLYCVRCSRGQPVEYRQVVDFRDYAEPAYCHEVPNGWWHRCGADNIRALKIPEES